MIRAALLVAALGAALGATVSGGAPAADAAPPSACTPTTGVMVAVDFGHWGNAVQRGCDPTPGTGLDALQTAGFAVAGTARYGLQFICRINDKPSTSDEPCRDTPSASSYWSYWHADPGQSSWSYARIGAASYHPKPGSVDGWAFGAGTRPGVPPSSVRATAPAPTPTPTRSTPVRTTQPVPPRTTASAPPPARSSTAPSAARSSVAPTTAAPTRTTRAPGTRTPRARSAPPSDPGGSGPPSVSTAPTSAAATSGPVVVDVSPVAAPVATSPGSPAALLVGGAAVLAVAAAAGAMAWRRRSP